MKESIYTYRDLVIRLSKKTCAEFLQALAISGGSINVSYVFKNGFKEDKVAYWEMHFRLRMSPAQVEKLHNLGFITEEVEMIEGKIKGASNPLVKE